MKRDQVEVGKVYAAKISGKIVPVRLDSAYPRGGWFGTNLKTNRQVRIKTAARLRYLVTAEFPV